MVRSVFRGFCYQFKRNYPAARADLENAVRLGPEASYPYLSLIILDLREGQLKEAKLSLAVVQQQFKDPDLATRQMRAFFAAEGKQNLFSLMTSSAGNLALGNFPSVEKYTQSALELLAQAGNANASPEAMAQAGGMIADLNVQRGLAQCNSRKYADAEQSYSDRIAADPSFTLLYLLRAEVRLRQGNQPGAAEDMAAAQQNAPSPYFADVLRDAQAGQFGCEAMLSP